MRNFAFRKPFFIWLSLMLLLAIFLILKASVVSVSEQEDFRELIDSSPKKLRKLRRKESRELTQQKRWIVCKQIYVADGPLRRLIEISAKRSEIRVMSKKPHMRVEETFYDAKGLVQHELFYVANDGREFAYDEQGNLYQRTPQGSVEQVPHVSTLQPKQRFRYFEADRAIYNFHTHQLLAHHIKFWTFTADGHEALREPFGNAAQAEGQASRMTLYVSGPHSKNQFSAEHLKIQFSNQRTL